MNKMKYKAALLVMLVAALAATVVFGAVRGTPRGRGPGIGMQSEPPTEVPERSFGRGSGGPSGPSGRGGPGRGMMLLGALRGLDLTEDQKAAVQEILQDEDAQAARQAAGEGVREAMKALHEATRALAEGDPEATVEAVTDAAAVLGEAMATQALLQAETLAAIKGLLTDEQLAKLAEMKAKAAEVREKLSDPDVQRALKMRGETGGRSGRGGPGGFSGRGGFQGGPGEWAPERREAMKERFKERFGR